MLSRYPKIAVLFVALAGAIANAETVTWNVRTKYGVSAKGIRQAIGDAKIHFRKSPNDVVILEFDEGSFFLEDKGPGKGTIDLSGVKPGPNGRLIFKGKGISKTTLVFSDNKHAICGRSVYRVTMSHMHMTRKEYTVSQGNVVQTAPGSVVLDIHKGFPTPAKIFNPLSGQGRYLRRYTNSKTDPLLIQKDNDQIPWTRAIHIKDRRWKIELKKKTQLANYSKGDLIGIKSKHGGTTEFGGQTYWFLGGSDFLFESVKWTQKTRGVFRGGFDKIRFLNCVTDRSPPINGQTPCLAAPGGGPQIGQPNDPPTSGNVVKNCRFIASGDDAVAFFNASGEISGCYIRDAFWRGILAANSPKAVLTKNTLIRCPVQLSKDHRMHKKKAKSNKTPQRTGK